MTPNISKSIMEPRHRRIVPLLAGRLVSGVELLIVIGRRASREIRRHYETVSSFKTMQFKHDGPKPMCHKI